jgi:hypothetical protein
MLQLAKSNDGLFIPRIDHEMKAAESFHCHDRAVFQAVDGTSNRFGAVRNRLTGSVPDFQMRAARRTRVRLRMEPAVSGIFVLTVALLAHFKAAHRRIQPVVRKTFDDRKARPQFVQFVKG